MRNVQIDSILGSKFQQSFGVCKYYGQIKSFELSFENGMCSGNLKMIIEQQNKNIFTGKYISVMTPFNCGREYGQKYYIRDTGFTGNNVWEHGYKYRYSNEVIMNADLGKWIKGEGIPMCKGSVIQEYPVGFVLLFLIGILLIININRTIRIFKKRKNKTM